MIPETDFNDWQWIKKIFSTGRGRPRRRDVAYKRLAYCMREGFIEVTETEYEPIPDPPEDDFAERFVFESASRDTGGLTHQRLKWQAWNWCCKSFGEKVTRN